MKLHERIVAHAAQRSHAVAVSSRDGVLSYGALQARIEQTMDVISRRGASVIGLDLENGPDWVILDIAALALDLCIVPLPPFFSGAQLRHAVTEAGVQAVISDRPRRLRELTGDLLSPVDEPLPTAGRDIRWLPLADTGQRIAPAIPAGVHKITFTSGTTGTPKGVLLGWPQMRAVAEALASAVRLGGRDRHLALMPLAVLLENIAGVYAPLWIGAQAVLAATHETGVFGAAGVDGVRMAAALMSTAASTAILTPQTLQALVTAIEEGSAARPPLRFAAVGGAPVSPRLLRRADAVGLPVYEGYGLSECSSVICLNTPSARRDGSVGRPLPHVDLAIAADGEVVVNNSDFIGYLGEPPSIGRTWRTGDLGHLDADGFLYLDGRKRNVFITALGRNVAPEWVETELTLEAPILQAAVFGEARPFNTAVIVPADGATAGDLECAIARVNRTLPDYARIARWIVAGESFSTANGMLTGTGRIRREPVWTQHREAIESLYPVW